MKKILSFLTLIFILNYNVSAQAIWSGAGDGTSWNDAANWEAGVAPAAGEKVEIGADVTITGTAPNIVSQVKAVGGATVVLDLDLTIGDGVVEEHGVTLASNSSLIFGVEGNNRAFIFNPESTRQGIAIFASVENGSIFVAPNTSITFAQANNGINLSGIGSSLINEGVLSFTAAVKNAFKILGTVENEGDINISAVTGDAVGVGENGNFTNNGSITADKPSNDVVEIEGGTFINNGSITGVIKDDAGSGNNVIAVGTAELAGTFINGPTGTINADAGVAENGRAISVNELGDFTNEGTVTVSGGNEGSRLYSRGIVMNAFNAILDLTDGRINANAGTFTNNGLIKTTRDGSGIFSTAEAILTNNAFIDYENSNNFASGEGVVTDNGISINANAQNFMGACSDTLTIATYEYFYEDNSIGTVNSEGVLDVTGSDFPSPDSVQITTTIPGVGFYIKNYCAEAVFEDITDNVNNIAAAKLKLYPTLLFTGMPITVDLTEMNASDLTLFISDAAGKIVRQVELTGGNINQISSDNLTRGIHFFQIITPDTILRAKVILQ